MRDKGNIRVAIAGVGNCASSLIQGLKYYNDPRNCKSGSGLIFEDVAGYLPSNIEICAAFDVNSLKVGRDLSEAIFASPNNTLKFSEVSPTGIRVQRGPILDGVGPSLSSVFEISTEAEVDVVDVLRKTKAQVLVCYLPVGSQQAVEFYASAAIEAGCAVVNCVPVFLASTPVWAERFRAAGLPIVGDDIKSQVGATIVHRVLAKLLGDRGVHLDSTYQLNFGGNTDFLNMLDRERLESKKISKTQSVVSQINEKLTADNIHIGPSDYVPWLKDRKFAHIRLEGTGFGGAPINIELKLEVWDSPNSAAVVMDAIRIVRVALDRGIKGPVEAPSAYYMKSPPTQMSDGEARKATLEFVKGS